MQADDMRKYVIMGVQGSGKGTQAKMLAEDLDLVHISVGDIFRWNVQDRTKMGAQVRRIMASGELVGDDLAESVVRDRLTQHDWNYGFIIDGFPRNRGRPSSSWKATTSTASSCSTCRTAKFVAGSSTAGCAATAGWTTT